MAKRLAEIEEEGMTIYSQTDFSKKNWRCLNSPLVSSYASIWVNLYMSMSLELTFGLSSSKKIHTVLRVTEVKCEVRADRKIERNIHKVKQCGKEGKRNFLYRE